MAIEYKDLIELVQDEPDTNSWVGSPGRQKFLATPVVNGVEIQDLANGPRGAGRTLIGPGKPIYLFLGRKPMSWLRPEEVERLNPFCLFISIRHPERIPDWDFPSVWARKITPEERDLLLRKE